MVTITLFAAPDLSISDLGDQEIQQAAYGLEMWINSPRKLQPDGSYRQGPAGAYSQGAYAVTWIRRGLSVPAGDSHTWLVELHATSDVGAGVLGYHAVRNGTSPYAKIFVADCARLGVPWTVACSHEVVEMMVNRYGNDLALQGMPDGSLRANNREACDPVEAGVYAHWFAYGGTWTIAVSDYVLPTYWVQGSPGPWDDRGVLTAALTPDVWGRQTWFAITGSEQTAARVHLASGGRVAPEGI